MLSTPVCLIPFVSLCFSVFWSRHLFLQTQRMRTSVHRVSRSNLESNLYTKSQIQIQISILYDVHLAEGCFSQLGACTILQTCVLKSLSFVYALTCKKKSILLTLIKIMLTIIWSEHVLHQIISSSINPDTCIVV